MAMPPPTPVPPSQPAVEAPAAPALQQSQPENVPPAAPAVKAEVGNPQVNLPFLSQELHFHFRREGNWH